MKQFDKINRRKIMDFQFKKKKLLKQDNKTNILIDQKQIN